jgi:tetratricopeptide (TPR) repeat protein
LEGHKPKIPRVVAGIAIHTLPLGPMEGFVLSRIDASASIADIADLTSLPLEEVTGIVEKLMELGAVEWADGTVHLPRMSAKSIAPPRMTAPRPSQLPPPGSKVSEVHSSAPPKDAAANRAAVRILHAPTPKITDVGDAAAPPTSTTPAAPAPTPNDGIELPMDRRKRIDDLYFAIDLLDHYQVLGITRRAGKPEVRSAYFELSKAFHPDTAFRKNVGTYRQKMEIIFKRLTEAYEVLGKKKARDEYDSYLASIGESRDAEEALSGENEIPAELQAPVAAPAPVVTTPTPPPAPLPPRSTPTEEGKRVARELLQKRLGGAKPPVTSAPAAPPPPATPPGPPVERSKKEVLRDLAGTLRTTAAQTGGLDRVTRLLADARQAEAQNDLAGAVRAYRLALALAPERVEIAETHERLARELAVSLAGQYEQQAIYEEKHYKWATAATNWGKVVEGRPDDVRALTRAATTLVEAKGDLHVARKFAQRAVDLAPEDASAHFALGRVFHAAALTLNAKRELELVRKLDPNNAQAVQLLKELAHQG